MQKITMYLTTKQKKQLKEWRKEVIDRDHILDSKHIIQIENEVKQWSYVRQLPKDTNYFEAFHLYDSVANKVNTQTWRGLAHWLWLRHGSVHGMLFTPNNKPLLWFVW